MVEIVNPVGDRRMFGHDAGGIGHQGKFLWFVRSDLKSVSGWIAFRGTAHSSVTSIAISGQLAWASQALSSSPAGTRAVADFVRIAEFVELEQFGRQRFAAGVSLALVLVDVDFQFSGHGRRSP